MTIQLLPVDIYFIYDDTEETPIVDFVAVAGQAFPEDGETVSFYKPDSHICDVFTVAKRTFAYTAEGRQLVSISCSPVRMDYDIDAAIAEKDGSL